MRKNKGNVRRDQTGRAATHAVAASLVYKPEQRETVWRGLGILAKIIPRAHLRRQAALCGAIPGATNGEHPAAVPHGPPPKGETKPKPR